MHFEKLLSVVMGVCFTLNVFGSENPRFDEEGRFLFCFTEPVKDMLNERLDGLNVSQEYFVFSQERFENLVDKINKWGWCELDDLEKYEIVKYLLYVDQYPTIQNKKFLLNLLESLREINDDNLITFCPSDRDSNVYFWINQVHKSIKSYYSIRLPAKVMYKQ